MRVSQVLPHQLHSAMSPWTLTFALVRSHVETGRNHPPIPIHKVASRKFCKMFWCAEPLRAPFTETTGPGPRPTPPPKKTPQTTITKNKLSPLHLYTFHNVVRQVVVSWQLKTQGCTSIWQTEKCDSSHILCIMLDNVSLMTFFFFKLKIYKIYIYNI